MTLSRVHHMPFGAMPEASGVRFRLWAPAASRVEVCIGTGPDEIVLAMAATGDGWFELLTEHAGVGSRYGYQIDGDRRVPDPASRFQPDDVTGPGEVIDPQTFIWQDGDWRGRSWHEAVIYELHVGTFTPAGTFSAIEAHLDRLVDLGITAIELMPVADFPGAYNWGYDGVLPFAPDSRYGRPEDLKSLVQAAHRRGLMIFLDVVYNHFGPEGNYLHHYAPGFFSDRHHTPWGAAINFDGPGSDVVRKFYIHNALYWLEEFHLDGLRLDAVHAMIDDSVPDILEELAQAVHARIDPGRRVHLVLENDNNQARYLDDYDAQWNDDLHHALHVIATGETSGYYCDYADSPLRHLGRALAEGFAWQGEPSPYRRGERRGEPSASLPPTAFVAFIQNHDQIGNRAFGERLAMLAPAEVIGAVSAILLLAPAPPLLFMGEEWGCTQPFQFFCDFGAELAQQVTEGRRREFAAFREFSDASLRVRIPDPGAPGTFAACRLDHQAAGTVAGRAWQDWYRRLLEIRRDEIVPRLDGAPGNSADYEVIGPGVLQVCWRLGAGTRLNLLTNLSQNPVTGIRVDVRGRCLLSWPEDHCAGMAAGSLPPWSVVWCLEELPA